jgi:hypothetical protein
LYDDQYPERYTTRAETVPLYHCYVLDVDLSFPCAHDGCVRERAAGEFDDDRGSAWRASRSS